MNPTPHHNQHSAQPHAAYTPAELLELASADALGLLDEQERKDFETAFAAASPRVQQLIRDQQLLEARQQIASLPEVIQPMSLRERVLSKVYGLISAESGVAGRIDRSLVDPSLDRRLSQSLPATRHVSRWWRAGAIGSLAAVVALGVMTLQMRGTLDKINQDIRTNGSADILRQDFGVRFEAALTSPGARLVQFVAADTAGESTLDGPKVALLINPATKSGQLVCKNLPDARGLVLTMVMPDGETKQVLTTFTPSNSRAFVQIEGLSAIVGTRFELRVAGSDKLLMSATVS